MKKRLFGMACVGMWAAAAAGQSVVINEFRNDAPDAIELVVVTDGLNMQGMILKDYSSSGANDGGGAFTFSSNSLWASVPAGTIIVLQKTNTATDVTVGGADYNLAVGLQNTTYFTAGSNTFDVSTEEIVQIKASGSGQGGSTGAIHSFATAGAGAQYTSAPTPKLKAGTGNTAFSNSVVANNATAALTDFNGTDATGGNTTGTIGTYNNANNQTYIESLRGPAVFGVTFDQTSGFTIEQGTSDVITAAAANGVAPYGYSWTSTLGESYRTADNAQLTILATAPIGDYSAQVIATDSDTPAKSVTNSLNFSVVAPAVKYAIAITPATNGTVTTTPATEAEAGQTVAINATPAGGYVVDAYSVVGADSTPIGSSSSFTMPTQAVTVTVTFKVHAGSALIISEVADPSDNANARFVELYNAGASSINLADGKWYLARQIGGGATIDDIALTGTVAAAGTYVISTTATNFVAAYPAAPAPNQFNGNISGNGDDGYFLYSGGKHTNGVLEDAAGVLNEDGTGKPWEYTDRRAARNAGVTAGNPTWTASEWTIPASAGVADMTPGVHPDGAAVFGVTFNKTDGFAVEQGSSDAIIATAANGTAPYAYTWSSTLGSSYYTTNAGTFTILATAPIGGYTSTVVAADSAAQSATNSLTFSVTAPAVKYAIAIVTNAPENGTVTTTPATEAAAGATVTVNATPAGGYAVDSIVVNGGAVAVNGTTFVMPAAPATVTVSFAVSETPDALIDFETYSGGYNLTNYVAGGVTWAMTNAYAGNTTEDRKNGTKAARLENNRGGTGHPAQMTSTAFAQPVTKISFWYANYGANDGGKFKVQVSDDGATWQDVGEAEYDPITNAALAKATIDTIPASMTYVQFVTTAGSAQRVNVDDIGIFFGAPVLGVTVDKASGFTVNQGSSDAITATAANGTAPYGYSWTSTLGASYRTTNGNVFTILSTAPTGSYSATVTATDAVLATAQKTVTFSVVGVNPVDPAVLISGSLSGTVGVEMALTVTITNETANDWYIDLRDPDGLEDFSYGWTPPAFTLTPTKTGTYVLTATADTGSGTYSNRVNLTVGGGSSNVWSIGDTSDGSTMFTTTSNILIVLPTNYTLNAVYGSDASGTGLNNLGQGLGPLNPGIDYTWNPATRTVYIINTVTNRRFIRIGATAP